MARIVWRGSRGGAFGALVERLMAAGVPAEGAFMRALELVFASPEANPWQYPSTIATESFETLSELGKRQQKDGVLLGGGPEGLA